MLKVKPDKSQAAIDKAAEECDQIDCMFDIDRKAGTWKCIECGKTGRHSRQPRFYYPPRC